MLLMTQSGQRVPVEEYRDVFFEDAAEIGVGVLIVRDERKRPMPIVVGYARISGRHYLVPIIRATFDDGDYRATLIFGDGHVEHVDVSRKQRTVRMLLSVGMYLAVPRYIIETTRDTFMRSPLYRSRVFWMEMWAGVSTFIALLVEGLPGKGISVLDERAHAEIAPHSLGKDRGEEISGEDLIAAQLGHLIGFSIAWDQLRARYPEGTAISPEMAKFVLLDAGTIIRFPDWMDQP